MCIRNNDLVATAVLCSSVQDAEHKSESAGGEGGTAADDIVH